MNKFASALIIVITFALLCNSCNKEDDVEEIFRNKTMYFTNGLVFSHKIQGDDLKELCSSEKAYCIYFGEGTYSLTLAQGISMSGKWQVDGKSNFIRFDGIRVPEGQGLSLSYRIANVLKNAVSYEGDANLITIIQDDKNRVVLSAKRSDNGYIGQ